VIEKEAIEWNHKAKEELAEDNMRGSLGSWEDMWRN
jgi:hypothetical protein